MKTILLILITITSHHLLAYPTGSFECKNRDGLPNNQYSIKSISMDGATIPFVEITRYIFRGSPPNQTQEMIKIAGFAVHSESSDSELLTLASVRMEFQNEKMVGCQTP